ncbi:MAG: hypothetical protein E7680_02155 [Ruminococcaceae bacterium]|nr:hypothetical protein [Oscillospiraceae bacterium]
MTKKNTIKINYQNSTIELSKATAKEASVVNSDAYTKLLAIRNEFPTFKVVVKERARSKKNLKGLKGLNFSFMENYIKNHSDSETHLSEFATLKASGISFFEIKQWFLKTYPIFKDISKSKADCILAA